MFGVRVQAPYLYSHLFMYTVHHRYNIYIYLPSYICIYIYIDSFICVAGCLLRLLCDYELSSGVQCLILCGGTFAKDAAMAPALEQTDALLAELAAVLCVELMPGLNRQSVGSQYNWPIITYPT